MNSKNIIAISKDKTKCICMKCLKESRLLKEIDIPEMGYGSAFDGTGTKVILCKDCYIKSNSSIWSMETRKFDEYCEEYLHEDEMLDYISQLPLQSQELVFNEFKHGWNTNYSMEAQDWIDYRLNELPHEKCKEYGLYSPEEINAYKERYPKCEYVYNTVWNDGSKSSHCAMRTCTSGEYGGQIGINYSTECYKCPYFKERITPIKDIKGEEHKDYELYIQSKVKMFDLENKFN